jgi:hypothetical protein
MDIMLSMRMGPLPADAVTAVCASDTSPYSATHRASKISPMLFQLAVFEVAV